MRATFQVLLLGAVLVLNQPVSARAQEWTEVGPTLVRHETAKLLPAEGQQDDNFATAVSISGGNSLVGVPLDDDNGTDSGSAHIFVRSGGVWAEQDKLLAVDGAAGDNFGIAVAISGDTALIGAPGDDDNGTASGSAYILVRNGSVWTEQAKLRPDDGEADDAFGISVALVGETALVGAWGDDDGGIDSGAAYVFVRSGNVWSEQAKLRPSDAEGDDGFGFSVSVSGDTALVGALGDDDSGSSSGSAYAFVRSDGVWTEESKLLASDGAADDEFGFSVALADDTALVGSPGDDETATSSGSAYVFVRSGNDWTEQSKLVSNDPGSLDEFGFSVSVSGDTALVGVPREDEGLAPSHRSPSSFRGSAFVFVRSGFVWTLESKLIPSDAGPFDFFGNSVSLAGDRALVGSWFDDDNGSDSGSAYLFEPESFELSVTGSCPGSVTVAISNAPPNSEVGIVAAENSNGFTKGGALCNGIQFEVGEPFQLPPLWIKVDGDGSGSGNITLKSNRCWMEAMALASCETTEAVLVP